MLLTEIIGGKTGGKFQFNARRRQKPMPLRIRRQLPNHIADSVFGFAEGRFAGARAPLQMQNPLSGSGSQMKEQKEASAYEASGADCRSGATQTATDQAGTQFRDLAEPIAGDYAIVARYSTHNTRIRMPMLTMHGGWRALLLGVLVRIERRVQVQV
jgi:hypothetical protein